MEKPKKTDVPRHPGITLELEFLKPLGVSSHRLSMAIGVDPMRIFRILHGKIGMTADTALRLARFFRTTPEFWMDLQTQYELACAVESIGNVLDAIDPHRYK